MQLSDVLSASVAWNPEARDTILVGATEVDLPIVETIVAALPARSRGRVFVEVDSAESVRELQVPGRVCLTWLVLERGQSLAAAVAAWLAEMVPVESDREHRVYAWISGDSSAHAITSA